MILKEKSFEFIKVEGTALPIYLIIKKKKSFKFLKVEGTALLNFNLKIFLNINYIKKS